MKNADTTFFSSLASRASQRRRRVAVAAPRDEHTADVVRRCAEERRAAFLLVADERSTACAATLRDCFPQLIDVTTVADDVDAATHAVAAVRRGDADVLMKGSLNTDVLLRAVLNKQGGLLSPGAVMCHVAAAVIPAYSKPLIFSDVAVVPRPTTEQFDAIVRSCLRVWRATTGGHAPHVALTHCTEKQSEKFPHTLSYAEIIRRADEGRYGDAVVGGPMDVRTACDPQSARIKGIVTPAAGSADIIIFPNIEAGNTFYKTITLFAGAQTAGLLCGTEAPVVVASRADSALSKYNSLLMALATR